MAIIDSKDDGSTEVSFKGCVVAVYKKESRVMSDVYADVLYATVYKADLDTFEDVYVRAYFECDRGNMSAVVDATPAIQDLYAAHLAVKKAEYALNEAKRSRTIAVAALKAPAKGRTVKVVKGRKVPVGTVGECFWVGSNDYGARVGIKDATGTKHFTAASNVEAVI
jgi:hypothetical protein